MLAVPDHEERRRLARRIVRQGMSVRAAERAARWAGARDEADGAEQPVDPALAERARDAPAARLTGADAKVAAGRVELYFDERGCELRGDASRRSSGASLQSSGAGD